MIQGRSDSPALVADPQQPRLGGTERPMIDVAVGILIRDDGQFLLTSRPAGKAYAGYWEFPGGKVEAGESVQQALMRELFEELGVRIEQAQLWRSSVVDYPHALVQLHFCKVFSWTGRLLMRESQQYAWEQVPVAVQPVLPGTLPVLDWLRQESETSG